MTHRSPLVTLLGLVVAFAIMFGVNMASSAPRDSYDASPSSAPSATAAVPSPADQTSAAPTSEPPSFTPPPSPSETEEVEKFPNKVVYAGRTDDDSAAIAVAILGDQAAAYLCDGRDVESWLRGTVKGDEISLTSKKGASLEARLVHGALEGKIEVADKEQHFTINEAKPPAGLYRARGAKTTIGWIILPDGSQEGIQTTGEESTAAPKLDPDNPQVTVDGESLQGEPVSGDLDV
ncbi:MAG TPA: hypothetical protein VGW74_15070 [Propionibacteriaceae bacterium]|nr:hypothetical protein [Propionibacteriaceae bacterium]